MPACFQAHWAHSLAFLCVFQTAVLVISIIAFSASVVLTLLDYKAKVKSLLLACLIFRLVND